MSSNRNQASTFFDDIIDNPIPIIVAYFNDDELLLYDLNPAAQKIWEVKKGSEIKPNPGANWFDQACDDSLLLIFDPSTYALLLDRPEDPQQKQILKLNYRFGTRSIIGQIHYYDWGLWIEITNKRTLIIWPSNLDKTIDGLADTAIIYKKYIAVAASILITLATLLTPIIENANISLPPILKRSKLTKIQSLLQAELAGIPGPVPNRIAYWEYEQNYRFRRLIAVESSYLRTKVLDPHSLRSTNEEGWDDQLLAHKKHDCHSLKRADLSNRRASAYLLFQQTGTDEILTCPVYRDLKLIGFMSIAYQDVLSERDRDLVYGRLQRLANQISIPVI